MKTPQTIIANWTLPGDQSLYQAWKYFGVFPHLHPCRGLRDQIGLYEGCLPLAGELFLVSNTKIWIGWMLIILCICGRGGSVYLEIYSPKYIGSRLAYAAICRGTLVTPSECTRYEPSEGGGERTNGKAYAGCTVHKNWNPLFFPFNVLATKRRREIHVTKAKNASVPFLSKHLKEFFHIINKNRAEKSD